MGEAFFNGKGRKATGSLLRVVTKYQLPDTVFLLLVNFIPKDSSVPYDKKKTNYGRRKLIYRSYLQKNSLLRRYAICGNWLRYHNNATDSTGTSLCDV